MIASSMLAGLLFAALGLFGCGILAAPMLANTRNGSRWISNLFALCGAVVLLVISIAGFFGTSFQAVIPGLLPIGGGVVLGIDRLSSFFLFSIAIGVIPSVFYAIGYTREHRSAGAMACAINVFIPAMVLVVLARNVMTFLFFWEVMSLASYFLVMTERDREATRSAGWVYLVMTHAGLACLLIGFLSLSHTSGTFSMSDWAKLAGGMDLRLRGGIFLVLSAGFLSKAGAIPLHVWLPRAHPAAPSHVSAMMSGVMIKLGIYGLIRVGLEWLGMAPVWWGVVVLVLGAGSALLGVLYAITDSDLKRVLAYSTIENVGVILLGIGAAMLFRTFGLGSVAALALTAALLHSLNHTVFKSLLFLGAGSVVRATGTRNMEEMGGLLKRLPQTGAFFLVGSLAISAMPPFNGFISEWLTFQALLLSFRIPEQIINLVFALAIAALALTAGLAAACFVRAFGITFLALPRSEAGYNAHEADWTMKVSMGLLSLLCVVLGVAPFTILRVLSSATQEFIGEIPELSFNWSGVAAGKNFSAITPLWVALLLGMLVVIAWMGLRLAGVNRRSRYYETWGCGRAVQTARFEYTASAFANPFRRVFAFLYRSVDEIKVEAHPESRFFVKTITYRQKSRSIIEESVYSPLVRAIRGAALKARTLQSGNVHSYLLYILLALLALLLLAK